MVPDVPGIVIAENKVGCHSAPHNFHLGTSPSPRRCRLTQTYRQASWRRSLYTNQLMIVVRKLYSIPARGIRVPACTRLVLKVHR